MTTTLFRVAVVVGTRPEAIKLAPVILELARAPAFQPLVVSTAQHRGILDQVLELFEIRPDVDLDLMAPNQALEDLAARALRELTQVFRWQRPDLVMVQGDTTTAMVGGLAAYYAGCPVAHVEAGLRSHHKDSPFPEEVNRRVLTQLADLHFAPTSGNRRTLLSEGISPESVLVTGNTVIDALLTVAARVDGQRFAGLVPGCGAQDKLMLVTAHRRESFGAPLRGICTAIRRLAADHEDLHVLYPVHPNPNVREVVDEYLRGRDRIHLVEPLHYLDFVTALKYSTLILTDSGGVQEEAPSLGKPVLVVREETERPEGVEAGVVSVVGRDPDTIVATVGRLLTDGEAYAAMARRANPYGDGRAAERVVAGARAFLETRQARRVGGADLFSAAPRAAPGVPATLTAGERERART
jgi:UDP-N-acetylglucosamine 2-epimerase (non-hydrolysing)